MENTTTEIQPKPETKAAPAAAAPSVPEPKPASAPAATTTVAAPAPAEKPQPSGEPKPEAKDIARRAFHEREQKREKKASDELAELRKELAAIKAGKTPEPPAAEPELSPFDDHKKWEEKVAERAEQRALDTIEKRQAEAKAQAEYHQTSEKAANFLLTRSHLKEDRALLEEVLKVVEKDYAHLAATDGGRDPGAAAELAYIRVCQAKGIMPDLDGFKSAGFDATKGAASIGARHSAPAGEKKSWSKREAEKYLMEAAKEPAKFKARSTEIEEAKKEGRIK